jgi:hypothetical protein
MVSARIGRRQDTVVGVVTTAGGTGENESDDDGSRTSKIRFF